LEFREEHSMKSFIKTSILLLLALGVAISAQAQGPVQVLGPGTPGHELEAYLQTWHRTLDADTTYVLTGFYYVDSTYSLTIPAGTKVLCAPGSALIIRRGAQIHATGTVNDPIVFAPTDPPGERERGEWSGVIILGEAPVNQVNPAIEGIEENGLGNFGGALPADDSGEFYYVRIEYPGYRIEEGNEVNGLTMGGVGSGTEIHHVQISYSWDDAYEWFGGTVDCSHLVVLGCVDDMFDTDFGYSGDIQFGFVLRDPTQWDSEGQSNGWESDNEGSALNPPSVPRTSPTFSNITLVGPERNDSIVLPPTHKFEFCGVLRRCSQNKIFNSVVMGFPWGLSVRDACTHTDAVNDVVEFAHTSLQASLIEPGSSTVHQEDKWPGTTTPPGVAAWILTEPGYNAAHSQPRNPSTVGLTDMSTLTNPNPIPAPGSELIGTANFTDPDLAGFTVTTYRGAFDPTRGMESQWTAGWTNFDPQNTVYWGTTGVSESITRPVSASQNYPNPFNPVTRIAYSVRQAGNVTITVHNAAGRVVRTLLSDDVAAGDGVVMWDGTDDMGQPCASGVYFYSIQTPEYSETHKMVMLK
jgi:hypothetical protein